MLQFVQPLLRRIYARILSSLIRLLNMAEFKYRTLTPTEIALAQRVFGDLIHYNEVKIFNIPYLPWQPPNVFMAPNGNVFVHQKYFSPDYTLCSISLQGVFIHEMTHVLQYQQQRNVLFKGAVLQLAYYLSLKRYNPYHYQYIEGKAFKTYNIEQQGDIARDIFFNKIPNIILRK